MTNLVRRLLVAGLTLILAGGAIVPVTAQATTGPVVSAVTDSSHEGETVQFDSIQLPYNIIIDENGNESRIPWYPDAPEQNYSRSEVEDEEFGTKVPNGVVSDSNFYSTSISMRGLLGGVDPKVTLGQYLADVQEKDNVDDLIEYNAAYVKVLSSMLKAAAQISLNPQETNVVAKERELQDVLSELSKSRVDEVVGLGKIFGPIIGTVETLKENKDMILSNKSDLHLDQFSTEQLTRLSPADSAARERKLLGQSVGDFVSEKDNKIIAEGQLSSTIQPNCFVFKKVAAPTTPSTVSSKPVIVRYIDEQGQSLKPNKTLTGSLGDDYQTEPLAIDGYDLVKTTGEKLGKFTSSEQTITYTYRKVAADTAIKNSVIYATKKIGLYDSPTFTKQSRLQLYAQKSRMNRPMFKIIGTATSKNGIKRYQVVNLNGQGITGYITAKAAYSTRLYYATQPSRVTVINPDGLNAYTKKNLTGKAIHYRQGQVLKVKRVVTHNLTTRLVLSNGRYISGNKKLIIAGKYTIPKRVQAKTAVNRYDTIQLTKRNRHYTQKSQAVFKVQGWAYTNANNFRKGDTLRYKVAGGYITGTPRFVKAIE